MQGRSSYSSTDSISKETEDEMKGYEDSFLENREDSGEEPIRHH